MSNWIDQKIEQGVLSHINRQNKSGWRLAAHFWLMMTRRCPASKCRAGIRREFTLS